MTPAELILAAAQAAELIAKISANVDAVRRVASVQELGELDAALDQIHQANRTLATRLDAALAEVLDRPD